jgi:RHS repeat-associated protein
MSPWKAEEIHLIRNPLSYSSKIQMNGKTTTSTRAENATMAQQTVRTRTPANQEGMKSPGRWNRDTHSRNRDYSPTLGRFMERDPIGFEAGDNNWYRFVANGPTGKTDPLGLDRYRLGGNAPWDHSIICVDLYDSNGKPTGGQYCCELGAVNGSGSSTCCAQTTSISDLASTTAAMCGLWFHPAKIFCGPRTLTPAEKGNQRVSASQAADERLLGRLQAEADSDTHWNGAVSNCHLYATGRLDVGLTD